MTQQTSITLDKFVCLNANPRYDSAKGLASSYRCPRGSEPGTAYVLMLEPDLAKLDRNSALTLKFTAGQTCAFVGLYFVVARRVSGGHTDDDKNGAYLVELADVRHLLERMTATERFINVRCPAPPATSGTSMYYADSLSSGSLYTWQAAVAALWPTLAGAAPTLPYTPTGTPENFRFVGVSAWCAVHEVLEKIGCTTAYNPFTGVFSIVRMGADQADFTAAKTKNTLYLNDADPYSGTASKIPATIRVFFHRQEVNYGIEKDTIQGAGQWAMDPAYSADVATGRAGAVAGTVIPLWDDLPALVDSSGSMTNASDCATRASDRATAWLAQHDTTRFRRVYSGCLPDFVPGAQVLEVVWSAYGLGDGYRTTVGAGPPIAPKASGMWLPASCRENIAPPDMARRQFPTYPRTDQIVQPWDGSTSAGQLIAPNGDHVIAGRVMRYTGPFAALEDCWLLPMGIGAGTSATAVTDTSLTAGDRLLGRLMGTLTSGGNTKPLYVVQTSANSPGGPTGTVPAYYWSGYGSTTTMVHSFDTALDLSHEVKTVGGIWTPAPTDLTIAGAGDFHVDVSMFVVADVTTGPGGVVGEVELQQNGSVVTNGTFQIDNDASVSGVLNQTIARPFTLTIANGDYLKLVGRSTGYVDDDFTVVATLRVFAAGPIVV